MYDKVTGSILVAESSSATMSTKIYPPVTTFAQISILPTKSIRDIDIQK